MTIRTHRLWDLILVPALITFAVTAVRLAGELAGGPASLFSREAGGDAAIVGIVWLIPIFGIYFSWRLEQERRLPDPPLRILLASLLGFVLLLLFMLAANRLFNQFSVPSILVGAGGALMAAGVVYRASPVFFSTLIAYGLAARIPVALLMLPAMLGSWGTHYDVPPPGFPEMSTLSKWVTIGLVPQLTVWITFTMVFGGFFASLALFVFRRARTG